MPGLQHPAAPDRDAGGDAEVVDARGPPEAAHPAGLDVDDPARPEGQRGLDVGPTSMDSSRQIGVCRRRASSAWPSEVVLRQRLLDQEQVELVERARWSASVTR